MEKQTLLDIAEVSELSNGTPVCVVPVPSSRTATIAIGCHAGGFYESGFGAGSIDGISHFLEHMFFKGTPHLTTREVNEEFTRLGATLNAFTDFLETVYYARVPARNISRAVSLWGELMNNIALDPKDFELEKSVVLQEVKLGEENPRRKAFHLAHESLFSGTQLQHTVIGTEDSVRGITRGQMRDYIDTYYAPENTCIVVTGGITGKVIIPELEQAFIPTTSGNNRGRNKRKSPVDVWENITPKWRGTQSYRTMKMDRPLSYVAINAALPASSTLAGPELLLLGYLLFSGKNSLLYKNITSPGVCSTAFGDISLYDRVIDVFLGFSTPPGNVAKVYEALVQKVLLAARNLKDLGKQLARLKTEAVGKLLMRHEGTIPLAMDQLLNHFLEGCPLDNTPANYLNAINAVDSDRIQAAIEALLEDWTCSLVIVGAIPEKWEPNLEIKGE